MADADWLEKSALRDEQDRFDLTENVGSDNEDPLAEADASSENEIAIVFVFIHHTPCLLELLTCVISIFSASTSPFDRVASRNRRRRFVGPGKLPLMITYWFFTSP